MFDEGGGGNSVEATIDEIDEGAVERNDNCYVDNAGHSDPCISTGYVSVPIVSVHNLDKILSEHSNAAMVIESIEATDNVSSGINNNTFRTSNETTNEMSSSDFNIDYWNSAGDISSDCRHVKEWPRLSIHDTPSEQFPFDTSSNQIQNSICLTNIPQQHLDCSQHQQELLDDRPHGVNLLQEIQEHCMSISEAPKLNTTFSVVHQQSISNEQGSIDMADDSFVTGVVENTIDALQTDKDPLNMVDEKSVAVIKIENIMKNNRDSRGIDHINESTTISTTMSTFIIEEAKVSVAGGEDQEMISLSSERLLSQKRIRDEIRNGDKTDSFNTSGRNNSDSNSYLDVVNPVTSSTKKKIVRI